MSTTTQYNPNVAFNVELASMGASKTVYALVTPETEQIKRAAFQNMNSYLGQFRDAWTGKQDAMHQEFFDLWHEWSKPVIDLDRSIFPFCYPTAGASEPLRHLIFDFAAKGGSTIDVFKGEYEGYKAMAEAAGLVVREWHRSEWLYYTRDCAHAGSLFFVSQPAAIDGNVWHEFNDFIAAMPKNTVVADITYVGAVPESAVTERFNLNIESIRNIVFSLSKPFGVYYDRIGGMFSRTEDLGMFGNKWFKNLTSLDIGRRLLQNSHVFRHPEQYLGEQARMVETVSRATGS